MNMFTILSHVQNSIHLFTFCSIRKALDQPPVGGSFENNNYTVYDCVWMEPTPN